jgi:nucleoside-diphosphate-sugar epimerase
MSHVVPDLIQKILKGQFPLHILGEGNQIRHYTYAGDLADGIIKCMFSELALNQDFNISTDQGYTVLELAKIIWDHCNKGPFEVVTDKPFIYDVQKRIPDTTKAKTVLDFSCDTSLESALQEIIPWIKNQINIGGI